MCECDFICDYDCEYCLERNCPKSKGGWESEKFKNIIGFIHNNNINDITYCNK